MRRIIIFDSASNGHRLLYLVSLLDYWIDNEIGKNNELIILMPASIAGLHKNNFRQYLGKKNNIKFIPIVKNFGYQKQIYPLSKFNDWQIISQYSNELQDAHCFCLHLDPMLLALGLHLNSPLKEFSGIYFKPSFHYKYFHGASRKTTTKVKDLFKKQILWSALRNKKLHYVFSLDKYALQYINSFSPSQKVKYLPESSNFTTKEEELIGNLKERFCIHPNRKVFLLFGVIKKKKGIYELLEAIRYLPPQSASQLCLLIVGNIENTEEAKINQEVTHTLQTSSVQIIQYNNFIPENEVQPIFGLSDVVLALYPSHVGSSGIVVQASVAGKPILGSSFGLVGETIRRNKLGIAVNMNNLDSIVRGITEMIDHHENTIDKEMMEKFANENTPTNFAKTILDHLV